MTEPVGGNAPDAAAAATRQILKERARLLARPPEREVQEEQVVYVRVRVGGEHYGLAVNAVEEVLPAGEITLLPCTPAHVRGIVARRGEILSVLDLRPLLGLTPDGERGNHVVVLRSARMHFGLLVDAIVGVERVPLSRLQARLGILSGMREEYLQGVTDDQVIVLDVARILGDKRLCVNETP